MVRPGHRCPLLTGVNGMLMAHGGVGLPQDGRVEERVSRRVGELVSKRAGGLESRWSTPRLNDLDPSPPARYGSAPT
jgi:hypothetical protein